MSVSSLVIDKKTNKKQINVNVNSKDYYKMSDANSYGGIELSLFNDFYFEISDDFFPISVLFVNKKLLSNAFC